MTEGRPQPLRERKGKGSWATGLKNGRLRPTGQPEVERRPEPQDIQMFSEGGFPWPERNVRMAIDIE